MYICNVKFIKIEVSIEFLRGENELYVRNWPVLAQKRHLTNLSYERVMNRLILYKFILTLH